MPEGGIRQCEHGPEAKSNFGFVSKYKKDADTPTDNTRFRFKAGNLNFHSASCDWLEVTGGDYATFSRGSCWPAFQRHPEAAVASWMNAHEGGL